MGSSEVAFLPTLAIAALDFNSQKNAAERFSPPRRDQCAGMNRADWDYFTESVASAGAGVTAVSAAAAGAVAAVVSVVAAGAVCADCEVAQPAAKAIDREPARAARVLIFMACYLSL
jgi:hypothetical protein